MADTYSFDVVSEVDLQEVDNAVNQAMKEITSGTILREASARSPSTRPPRNWNWSPTTIPASRRWWMC